MYAFMTCLYAPVLRLMMHFRNNKSFIIEQCITNTSNPIVSATGIGVPVAILDIFEEDTLVTNNITKRLMTTPSFMTNGVSGI